MKISRLISIVLLLFGIIGVMGLVSIQGELTAAASAAQAKETIATGVIDGQLVVIEAEMVPEGRHLLLAPQVDDVLVKHARKIESLEGTYQFEDGKVYAWHGYERQRMWLFAVMADEKPEITVTR